MSKKSNKILHIIRLTGFDMEEGKIPFSLLCQLSEQITKISESTLRLYIEGNSLLKRGKMPDWLKSSLDFTWAGMTKGSTVLTMEAPLLSDTLKNTQYPLFNDLGTEDYTNDSAFTLAMVAYGKAVSDEKETDLLDKHLLKEMMTFKKLVSGNKATIHMTCPDNNREAVLSRENFEKIKILEISTRAPLKTKISGKLDMMKHSSSVLEILSDKRSIKVKLPDTIRMEEIKVFFGSQVTVTGMANFNPANQLVSILMADIKGANQEDIFFIQLPKVLKEKTEIKQLIKEKNYKGFNKTRFDKLIDELEVEEPIETLLNALTS
jgi:hypothetical protein